MPTSDISVVKVEDAAKRVGRTVIQVVVALGVALGVFQLVAPQVLAAISNQLPVSWGAWLAGAIVFIGGVAGALSRVMAIPAVNALVAKFGAAAPVTATAATPVTATTVVADPKAVVTGPVATTIDTSAATIPDLGTVPAEPVVAQPVDTASVELTAEGTATPTP